MTNCRNKKLTLPITGLGIPLLVSCAPRVILINPTAIVIAHYSLSAILNFMVTAMIAAKLLFHQRQLKQHNVSSNVYISAVGILAESAVLYSTSLIVYVILVARNSPATIWFSAVIMSASVSTHCSPAHAIIHCRPAVLEPSLDHPPRFNGHHIHPGGLVALAHSCSSVGAPARDGTRAYAPCVPQFCWWHHHVSYNICQARQLGHWHFHRLAGYICLSS
jgi:hypothetical protein